MAEHSVCQSRNLGIPFLRYSVRGVLQFSILRPSIYIAPSSHTGSALGNCRFTPPPRSPRPNCCAFEPRPKQHPFSIAFPRDDEARKNLSTARKCQGRNYVFSLQIERVQTRKYKQRTSELFLDLRSSTYAFSLCVNEFVAVLVESLRRGENQDIRSVPAWEGRAIVPLFYFPVDNNFRYSFWNFSKHYMFPQTLPSKEHCVQSADRGLRGCGRPADLRPRDVESKLHPFFLGKVNTHPAPSLSLDAVSKSTTDIITHLQNIK